MTAAPQLWRFHVDADVNEYGDEERSEFTHDVVAFSLESACSRFREIEPEAEPDEIEYLGVVDIHPDVVKAIVEGKIP